MPQFVYFQVFIIARFIVTYFATRIIVEMIHVTWRFDLASFDA